VKGDVGEPPRRPYLGPGPEEVEQERFTDRLLVLDPVGGLLDELEADVLARAALAAASSRLRNVSRAPQISSDGTGREVVRRAWWVADQGAIPVDHRREGLGSDHAFR
jgi:hypothetical protein